VQLAKAWGLHVVAVAGPANQDFLKQDLKADEVSCRAPIIALLQTLPTSWASEADVELAVEVHSRCRAPAAPVSLHSK
jgi:biotin carboxylase